MDLRSGRPFWPLKNGLMAAYPALDRDESCDVAVIGGGITGALVADALAAEGVDVVLLDRRDVAAGSTAASTSLLQYEIDVELVDLIDRVGEDDAVRAYRLGLEAIDRIEILTAEIGDDCDFRRRDSLYLASKPSHVAKLRREFECRRRAGFDVQFLEAGRLAEEYGFSAPAAILSGGDAEIDVHRLTHGLLRRSRERGCRIYDRTEVSKIRRSGGRATLRTDRGPAVRARRIVFATGYESQSYLRRKVGDLISTFAVVSEPMEPFPEWPGRCLVWETARPYFYLRSTPDGRILMGGGDEDDADDHRRDGLIGRKSAYLRRRFRALFPSADFEVAFAWAGVFGETEEGLARIGRPPERPDDYFAMGYGGNGITMSVTASRLITDDFLGRDNPDARIYRFDR